MDRSNITPITPKNELVRMQVSRLGNILFVWSVIAFALTMLMRVAYMAVFAFYAALVIFAMFSCFLLLLVPEYAALFSGGEAAMVFAETLMKAVTIVAPIAACLSAAAVACLLADKRKRQAAKIVVSAVFGVASLLVFIVRLAAGAP